MTNPSPRRTERLESLVQLSILLIIGTMAGAASFTHVHDWTMDNAPAGTGDWFGWANAVISELTPTAAGLEIRRRKRQHRSITYPMCVLIGAATLSLSAQVAEAKPGLTGWLLSAVPALAFLALSKLILARTNTDYTGDQHAGDPTTAADVVDVPAITSNDQVHHQRELPEQLLSSARMAAFAYQQANGHSISAANLAEYLGIEHNLAERLHAAIGEPNPATPSTEPARQPVPTVHANGVPYTGHAA